MERAHAGRRSGSLDGELCSPADDVAVRTKQVAAHACGCPMHAVSRFIGSVILESSSPSRRARATCTATVVVSTVRGMRTAEARTPRSACANSAFCDRLRCPTTPSVATGSLSTAWRPETHGVPDTMTMGSPVPMSASPRVRVAAASSATAASRASELVVQGAGVAVGEGGGRGLGVEPGEADGEVTERGHDDGVVRMREGSSPKVTSRTRWSSFSGTRYRRMTVSGLGPGRLRRGVR